MTVGERIKKTREELGMSQGDLAKKMNISRQAISKAELHDSNITTDKVRKFAEALGVTEAYLMGWENNDTSEDLTIEDAELIKAWKSADEETKKMIARILAFNNKRTD